MLFLCPGKTFALTALFFLEGKGQPRGNGPGGPGAGFAMGRPVVVVIDTVCR